MNKCKNRRIIVDSSEPKTQGGGSEINKILTKELGNEYPEYSEDIDSNLPDPLGDEMKILVFVCSDCTRDKVTRISITGIIFFVGGNLVLYSSKRQGSIETSTYGSDICVI